MLTGHYFPPARQNVYYGLDLDDAIARVSNSTNAKRILFVTNSSLSKSTLSFKILEALNKKCVDQIVGLKAHSPREDVIKVSAAIRKHVIDLVIGFQRSKS